MLEPNIRDLLTDEIPPLSLLPDRNDRFYVTRALELASHDWIAPYAAREAIREELAEKVRVQLVRILFRNSNTLDEAFFALVTPLSEWRPETDKPSVTTARRVRRLLAAARTSIAVSGIKVGPRFTEAVAGFVKSGFVRVSPPDDNRVLAELSDELANLVHVVVQSFLFLLADTDVYRLVLVPKRWFPPTMWASYTGRSKPIRMLRSDINHALTLIARQHVIDKDLFDVLEQITGSREATLKITAAIADAHPEVPGPIQTWLRTGRAITQQGGSTLANEQGLLSIDQQLAHCLIAAKVLRDPEYRTGLNAAVDVRTSTEISPSAIAQQTAFQSLLENVLRAANARDLVTFEEESSIVLFVPTLHQMIAGTSQGARKVQVVRVGVQRTLANNNVEVIVPALVKPIATEDKG